MLETECSRFFLQSSLHPHLFLRPFWSRSKSSNSVSITVMFMFHSFFFLFSSLARFRYLPIFLLTFIFTKVRFPEKMTSSSFLVYKHWVRYSGLDFEIHLYLKVTKKILVRKLTYMRYIWNTSAKTKILLLYIVIKPFLHIKFSNWRDNLKFTDV